MLHIREHHSIKKLLHNRGIGLDSPCGIHAALLGMNISNLFPPFRTGDRNVDDSIVTSSGLAYELHPLQFSKT